MTAGTAMHRSQPDEAHHLLFSDLNTWLRGRFHGVTHRYVQNDLEEFTYRLNRRHDPPICRRISSESDRDRQPSSDPMVEASFPRQAKRRGRSDHASEERDRDCCGCRHAGYRTIARDSITTQGGCVTANVGGDVRGAVARPRFRCPEFSKVTGFPISQGFRCLSTGPRLGGRVPK